MNKLSWSNLAGISPATVEPPALGRFLILSMLVHFLLIVLFGNTTGSSSSPGDSRSTPLGVRLRPLASEPGAGLSSTPGAETTPLGAALLRTLMGARQPVLRPRTGGGPPAAAVTRELAANPIVQVPAASEAVQPTPAATPPAQPPPVEPQPGLNLNAPEVVDKPLKPSAVTPPPVARPSAPPTDLPTREVPIIPPAPIERAVLPKVERRIEPPTAPAPREVSQTPTPAAERIARQPIEPAPAPPAPATPPGEAAETPAPPVAPVVPPKIERVPVLPIEMPPRATPVEPAAPIEWVEPPRIERTIAPPVERAVGATPVAPAPASPPVPTATPAPAAPVAPATPSAPAPGAREAGMPAETTPPPRVGAPDGRDDIFKPRPPGTMAPASQPGSAPRINLDAVRQRAREIATEGSGSRGLLPLQIPVPAERKSKLAEGIEKGIKPDCRNAYADAGLLAIPALVAGAIADIGCRW